MRHVAIFFVRLYQRWLSPILPDTCRFTPTCSVYAIEAFQKKGFFRGLALAVWRVLRCHPWGRGGHDPVEKTPPDETANDPS